MDIDWTYVKKKTLWHYENLIGKLLDVLAYPFVQEFYNHGMPKAAAYARRMQQSYLQDGKEMAFLSEVSEQFAAFDGLGVRDIFDLVQRVEGKTKCERFLVETGFSFENLILVLNYLMRYALPFKCPIRELLDEADLEDKSILARLRQQGIRSSLDALEGCRTQIGREKLAAESRLGEAFLLRLAHRADLTRLAYVRGKTARHLCGGGYDTLKKLGGADIEKMEADMTAYFASIGKRFADFKAAIPLDWMIGGARILPEVLED